MLCCVFTMHPFQVNNCRPKRKRFSIVTVWLRPAPFFIELIGGDRSATAARLNGCKAV